MKAIRIFFVSVLGIGLAVALLFVLRVPAPVVAAPNLESAQEASGLLVQVLDLSTSTDPEAREWMITRTIEVAEATLPHYEVAACVFGNGAVCSGFYTNTAALEAWLRSNSVPGDATNFCVLCDDLVGLDGESGIFYNRDPTHVLSWTLVMYTDACPSPPDGVCGEDEADQRMRALPDDHGIYVVGVEALENPCYLSDWSDVVVPWSLPLPPADEIVDAIPSVCDSDAYEPDDSNMEAYHIPRLIQPGDPPQLHNFFEGSEDWTFMQLRRGLPLMYRFIARPLSNLPITMTIHHGLTQWGKSKSNVDPTASVEIARVISCKTIEGCGYFLQLESSNSGCRTGYEVWVETSPITLEVTPATVTIIAGQSVSYTAIVHDADGGSWDVTDETEFSIDPGAGGNWNASVYTAEITGTWTVTGTYGKAYLAPGLTDTASLIVTSPPPQIQIEPMEVRKSSSNLSALADVYFTITNTGGSTLEWWTVEEPDLQSFSIISPLDHGTLEPGQSTLPHPYCPGLRYWPQMLGVGVHTTTLVVTSNDPISPEIRIPVRIVLGRPFRIYLPFSMR